MKMKLAHLTFAFAFCVAVAACTTERALSPPAGENSQMVAVGAAMSQVPLLYVVDGVRLRRDQVPLLTSEQIASVQVIKGHTALKQYGPDASYGVVVITTKAALAPHS
jgi:outer membrane cobalamin receptor